MRNSDVDEEEDDGDGSTMLGERTSFKIMRSMYKSNGDWWSKGVRDRILLVLPMYII